MFHRPSGAHPILGSGSGGSAALHLRLISASPARLMSPRVAFALNGAVDVRREMQEPPNFADGERDEDAEASRRNTPI